MDFVVTGLSSHPTANIQTDQLRRKHVSKTVLIQVGTSIALIFLLTMLIIYLFTRKTFSSININNPTKTTLYSFSTTGRIDLPSSTSSDHSQLKAGEKFGDITGAAFDDSLMKNFTSSHYLYGITLKRDNICLDWIQFFYSSDNHSENILQSETHGIREATDVGESFFLENDEKIFKVQLKVDNVQLYQNGVPSMNIRLIIAIRFFTTKQRSSPDINQINGDNFTEEYPGYTVGYVTGRSGRYIDQLQFYWYRTINN